MATPEVSLTKIIVTGIITAVLTTGGSYLAWSTSVSTRLSVLEAAQARSQQDRTEILEHLSRIEGKLDIFGREHAGIIGGRK